ncbi:cyanophycin synthetase [Micromonospora pattaloongensis]|uniref:Cyanophycin synthetase n=1 Tax=Micromonospora pattaloongensis TaxID=405436 RepID=A0A1H3RUV8_9ACTN|nr:cyanophycin synthetase [Micromonospora pattaloongensis]SDZ29514.1 cyanophycin synthetase [Micromonospora pattaloongensis]
MEVLGIRRLRGPNAYLERPVTVARLQLGALAGRETCDFAGFTDRLLQCLPGLAEHHCAAGAPGGLVRRLREGTYFGHTAEHVTIELSHLVGRDVHFGRTTSAGEPGLYDVIIECPAHEPCDSSIPDELLALAVELVRDVLAGRPPRHEPALSALRERVESEAPGPSTDSIIAAARRRGIPVERVGGLSLLRLGHGRRRRLTWAAMTDQTPAIGVDLAGDKELTRRLLDQAGVPVPAGGAADTVEGALALFAEIGAPVVLKPRDGRQGRNVHVGLSDEAAVRAAFDVTGGAVVVERQLGGRDYRVLVVGDEVVAAAEQTPAHVVGDGTSTVAALVDAANTDPRRGAGHSRFLSRLRLDDTAGALLAAQDLHPGAVPRPGRVVWLRHSGNLSTGGTSRDVTDQVHPDVARMCRRAARIIGLDIAGIDLRLPDIAAPVPPAGARDTDGGVIEVNAVPGLRMHLAPCAGPARDVGAAIVDALFPDGGDGRIPTAAITGTNGKTTTTRLTAHLMSEPGRCVGMTTTDGVYLDGRLVQHADATGPRSAQIVLGDPAVDVAVLETARGGIVRGGLGYDLSDVGVITNITADHLGQDGLDTVEDVVHVKALVAERVRDGGTLVLNADDPLVRGLVQRPRTGAARKRLVWFSTLPDNPLVRGHLAAGGTAYLLRDGWLVEANGRDRTPLLPAAELPGSFDGRVTYMVENALAAAAAARALGVSPDAVAHRLATFEPVRANPGRGMLWRLGEVNVFVDYAHNPGAIAAVTRSLHELWGPDRCVAIVTLPGDRRDDLLAQSARILADGFTRVVVYEDTDLRGRVSGEMPALLCRELIARRPELRCEQTTDASTALRQGLKLAAPGEVVLLLYEKLSDVVPLLEEAGATPTGRPLTLAVRR